MQRLFAICVPGQNQDSIYGTKVSSENKELLFCGNKSLFFSIQLVQPLTDWWNVNVMILMILILLHILFGWSHVFHANIDFKHEYKESAPSRSLQPVLCASKGIYRKD